MFQKKIVYISSINLLSKRAQSLQVLRFVKSLYHNCKKEDLIFEAFSLSKVPINYQIYFKAVNKKISNNRVLNNFHTIFCLFKNRFINKEDILYSRDLLLLFLFSLLGFKTVYEFHHPAPLVNTILFKLFNLMPHSRLITISNALKKYVQENHYFFKKEILVLPSSVDIEKYEKIPCKEICRKDLGMTNDKFYILHTGSPYPGRGIENFIDLCNFSEDIFFIHIGGNDDNLSRLKYLAKKAEINNCLFLSYLDEREIIKYQKAADLLFYIITSKWKTFWCCSPMKIPEYMASGTPILASKIGSITEMLDDQNSYLFDLNSISLNAALKKAKSNSKLSFRKAAEAKNKVENNYTWDIRSQLFIEFLKKSY